MVTRNVLDQACVAASMGRPVEVVKLVLAERGNLVAPFWLCKGMPEICRAGCGKPCFGFLDADLTPLPDLPPETEPSDAQIDQDLQQTRELEREVLDWLLDPQEVTP
jgi:hypothetical protein